MSFSLMDLPFKHDALEPFMSAQTLSFHHGKHHAGYIQKLNTLIKDTKYENMSLEDIIKDVPAGTNIFNNAAQVWNHNFFWQSIKPNGGGQPTEDLLKLIENQFTSVDKFIEEFKNTAMSQFGSGWAWLEYDLKSQNLNINKTGNAETPLTEKNKVPLLTVDVWEHAYYLDYQNLRPKYLDTIFSNLINWDFAKINFSEALK
ncbi:superoxide dismutase [Anaplasmataceae bacterium AB001_6]|nr:superoxide dismutase [Anaplasmataceae bacterium AB001_6]